MSNKIGFWSVFALVTGSQIGTGVFMLPANLAPYGVLSLGGWVIAGGGAVILALVFALGFRLGAIVCCEGVEWAARPVCAAV